MNSVAAYRRAAGETAESRIRDGAGLVKRIAYHLSGRLPNTVQIDDLIQAGMIGLIEAARNFDHNQGAAFETYAGIRIRGAMIDEVRRNGWAPRSVHRKAREVMQATHRLEVELGRTVSDNEVAATMGLTMEEYGKILAEATNHKLLSIDEDEGERSALQVEAERTESVDPYLGTQMERYREALIRAIEQLPERERLVMSLYYDRELNLREIGQVLGVTESRVCQIHGQAIVRLQARMKSWT